LILELSYTLCNSEDQIVVIRLCVHMVPMNCSKLVALKAST